MMLGCQYGLQGCIGHKDCCFDYTAVCAGGVTTTVAATTTAPETTATTTTSTTTTSTTTPAATKAGPKDGSCQARCDSYDPSKSCQCDPVRGNCGPVDSADFLLHKSATNYLMSSLLTPTTARRTARTTEIVVWTWALFAVLARRLHSLRSPPQAR